MSLTLAILLFIAIVRGLFLRRVVARDEQVRYRKHGLLSTELRRRAHLVAHPLASGGLSFPEPRETRTVVIRLVGLPVWREVCSIGLPRGVEGNLGGVRTGDFDAGFDERFRAARAPRFELTLA